MVYVKRAKPILKRTNILYAGIACLLLGPVSASVRAQDIAVSGQIEISRAAKNGQAAAKAESAGNVAVWLTPLENGADTSAHRVTGRIAQLVQKNKKFDPHLLIVEVGSRVEFPNKDPFFHNVFSLFNGKRFDLGLYEAGSSNSVRFDRAGISYLFCNIHPEMSAIVVSVPTPYYGVSNGAGKIAIPAVPSGRYRLHVWSERSSPEDLAKLERDVVISESSRTLEPIRVVESIAPELSHKNMYGKDYVPPTNSPGYTHP
jgi:plastocyanin